MRKIFIFLFFYFNFLFLKHHYLFAANQQTEIIATKTTACPSETHFLSATKILASIFINCLILDYPLNAAELSMRLLIHFVRILCQFQAFAMPLSSLGTTLPDTNIGDTRDSYSH